MSVTSLSRRLSLSLSSFHSSREALRAGRRSVPTTEERRRARRGTWKRYRSDKGAEGKEEMNQKSRFHVPPTRLSRLTFGSRMKDERSEE